MKKEQSLFELIKRILAFETKNKITFNEDEIILFFGNKKSAKIKIVEEN